jgi:hypothetical protein
MRGFKTEVTVRCYSSEIIQSQWGTLPIVEWLKLEVKRMTRHGAAVRLVEHEDRTFSIVREETQETSPGK